MDLNNKEEKILLIKKIIDESFVRLKYNNTLVHKRPREFFKNIYCEYFNLIDFFEKDEIFSIGNKIPSAGTRNSCIMIGIILRLFKPKIVCEIGRFQGYSTAQIAYNLKEIFDKEYFKFISIDPHCGADIGYGWDSDKNKQAGIDDDYIRSVDNLKNCGVFESVEVIREFSQKYLNEICDNVEFLFIDGDHTYDGCKKDLYGYSNKMKKDSFICIHDVWGENYRGVNCGPGQVYDEADLNIFEKIGIIWDIGILRKKV